MGYNNIFNLPFNTPKEHTFRRVFDHVVQGRYKLTNNIPFSATQIYRVILTVVAISSLAIQIVYRY